MRLLEPRGVRVGEVYVLEKADSVASALEAFGTIQSEDWIVSNYTTAESLTHQFAPEEQLMTLAIAGMSRTFSKDVLTGVGDRDHDFALRRNPLFLPTLHEPSPNVAVTTPNRVFLLQVGTIHSVAPAQIDESMLPRRVITALERV